MWAATAQMSGQTGGSVPLHPMAGSAVPLVGSAPLLQKGEGHAGQNQISFLQISAQGWVAGAGGSSGTGGAAPCAWVVMLSECLCLFVYLSQSGPVLARPWV